MSAAYREEIQFPAKDVALREDVHALGSLIGQTLHEQGGEEFFEVVEGDRLAAIDGATMRKPAMPNCKRRTAGRTPARRERSDARVLPLVPGGQHRRESAPRAPPSAVPR